MRPQAETGLARVACRDVSSIIKSSVLGCQNLMDLVHTHKP